MIDEDEAILDPEQPICDAHHHLWDRRGNRYLLPEFLRDLGGGHNIVSTVFVECAEAYETSGPDSLRPVGETRFADAVADEAEARFNRRGICAGIVGFVDLMLGAGVSPVLDAHVAASPRLRGIRHCATWHASSAIQNAHTNPPQGMLASAPFLAGFAELSKRSLVFDAWVFHSQIDEVATLARAFPQTTIVLDHLGGPLGIGPYSGQREEVLADWSAAMRLLAQEPNILVKLGGICMPLNGWGFHRRQVRPGSAEVAGLLRDYYMRAIDWFGVDRCMFESNYPADRSSIDYSVVWNTHKRLVADFSAADKNLLFHDNAVRTYRLGV